MPTSRSVLFFKRTVRRRRKAQDRERMTEVVGARRDLEERRKRPRGKEKGEGKERKGKT